MSNHDERDLKSLFAQAAQSPPDEVFVQAVTRRVRREQRLIHAGLATAVAVVIAATAVAWPYLGRSLAAVGAALGLVARGLGEFVASPPVLAAVVLLAAATPWLLGPGRRERT